MSSVTARGRGAWAERILSTVAVTVAGGLQLLVGYFTLSMGLLAPLWAIVLMAVVWLLAAALLVRLARRRPLVSPLVPVVNGLLVWAALAVGQAWLGWTP